MIFIGLLCLIACGFVLSVRFYVERTTPMVSKTGKKLGYLEFECRMNKDSYQRGEPVIIFLTARNISDTNVNLRFSTSLETDVEVYREDDFFFFKIPRKVWQYSLVADKILKPHSLELKPGQSKVFQSVWNQCDLAGNQVKPASYLIVCKMLTDDFSISLRLRGSSGGD